MSWLRSGVGIVVFLVGPLSCHCAEPGSDRAKLVGQWRATDGVWNGTPLTRQQAAGCRLTIAAQPDNPFGFSPTSSLVVPDKVVSTQIWNKDKLETRYLTRWEGFALAVSPSDSPKRLTLYKQNGLKGITLVGIYALEGDTLRICLSVEPIVNRPSEFKAPARSRLLLLTLKRIK